MPKTRKLSMVTALTAAFIMLLSNLALADIVNNNVASTAEGKVVSVQAGASHTVLYRVQNENIGAGDTQQNSCNPDDGTPVQISATGLPTGVTVTATHPLLVSPSTLVIGSCENNFNGGRGLTFQVASTTAPGNYTIGHSFVDANTSGGRYVNSSNFTLRVPAPADSTPPDITPNVSGTLGNNGWYTSNVSVSWTVTDPESTITSQNCPGGSVTSDTSGQTFSCTATSAGGTATKEVTIKRDATAPVVTPSDVNNTTWRNTPLSESFTASDALSGLANSGDASFTLEASAQSADASTPTTVSKTVADKAGNETTRRLSALIDLTNPTNIQFSGIAAQAYTNSSVLQTRPTCNADDGLSGLAGCVVTGYSNGVGTHTLTATATDNAGNSATRELTYSVYGLGEFNKNFDGTGIPKAKAGSTIPLQWKVTGENGPVRLANASLSSVAVSSCTDENGLANTEIAETWSGNSGLQYDADTGVHQLNWKSTTATGCRRVTVTMTLPDNGGTLTRSVNVNFTK